MPKRSYRTTTNAHHGFHKHKNLIEKMGIVRPEQVWVSYIAFLGDRQHACYLSLVTDAYSKKIVGYKVAENMNAEHSIAALMMAIRNRKDMSLPLIHHSDRRL